MTRRPLVFSSLSFILTCVLSSFISKSAIGMFLAFSAFTLLILIVLIFVFKKSFAAPLLIVFAGIALSLVLSFLVHIPAKEKALSFTGFEGNISGEVVSINRKEYYDRVVVKTRTVGDKKAKVKILFYSFSKELSLSEGDIVCLRGVLSSNNSKYYASEKIYLEMSVQDVRCLDEAPNLFRKFIYKLRLDCADNFERLDNCGLLKELVLGMGGSVDAQTSKDFKKLGLSHTLSVSGMHLSIIVMSLYSLLRENNLEKKSISIFCSAVTFLYMALTGFSFSIVRAGIMMIIYFSSALFRRRPDTLTSLFTAALFITVENPYAVFNVGFQLSFLATLGIVTLGSKTIKSISSLSFFDTQKSKAVPAYCKKALLKILHAFVINTSAILFTAPVILIRYGSVTPLSFIANISVLFIINLLLIVSLIYQVFSFLSIGFFGAAVNLLSDTVLFCTSRLAKALPDPISYSPEFSLIAAIVLTLVLIISLCVFTKRHSLLLTTLAVSISIIILQGIFFISRQNTTYITLSTNAPSYNVLTEENGQKSFICLDYRDLSASSIFKITGHRNVSSIDTALFFIKEKVPKKSIGALLETVTVDKIIIASLDGVIYSWQKREIEELARGACDIDYVSFNEYQVSNSVALEKMSEEYVCVRISQQDTTITLAYSFGKEFILPASCFESSDGIVLFGKLDYLPPVSPRDFYVYSLEDELFKSNKAQNLTGTEIAFIKVDDNKAKFTVLE